MTIKFGTEGWRAIMAEEFTAENVRLVAQAIAEHFLDTGPSSKAGDRRLAVGYDTRFLSDYFAKAVAEVLAANGVHVLLTDRWVPTCAVSRFVVDEQLTAGIMITASHNPALYNGIKVKESFGGSAVTETVTSIENRIQAHPLKRMPLDQAVKDGLVESVNMMPAFLNGMRRTIDLKAIRRSRLKVVAESMHGTADSIIAGLLKGGRCRVETLHADPDARFGGHAPEPIALHLKELSSWIKKHKFDIGIANDGDADRIGIVAPNGQFINPGQLLCVLLDHLMTSRGWTGTVVKTVSNTSMIERMTSGLGLKLAETAVGFKYIAKLMLEGDVIIGGEESGGIAVRGYLPDRDGIFIGLLLLEAMAMQGKSFFDILRRLEKRYGRWHYARRDLTVPFEQSGRLFEALSKNPPARLAGVPVAEVKTIHGIKLIDQQASWLLFRRSGTEPIVRVYAESLTASRVTRLLDYGVELLKKA